MMAVTIVALFLAFVALSVEHRGTGRVRPISREQPPASRTASPADGTTVPGYGVEPRLMRHRVSMAIDVVIPREQVQPALASLSALGEKQTSLGSGPADLVTALAAWRFEAEIDPPRGDVWIVAYRGHDWQDKEALFAALAPHARGEIVAIASGQAVWRHRLEDGYLLTEPYTSAGWSRWGSKVNRPTDNFGVAPASRASVSPLVAQPDQPATSSEVDLRAA